MTSFTSISIYTISRLITCEADKTIKIWKENALSTEESDPIDMKAWSRECLSMKKY